VVATVSEYSKKDIVEQYKADATGIDVVYSAAKEIFIPLGFEERQTVKEKYTGGTDYFVYTGAIHPRKNLLQLLKAFSVFKKKPQSAMKLVLAGRLAWQFESFTKNLKTYKYRDDVIMTGYLPEKELARLTASAYAMVYPSLLEGFGVPVLEAMQCQVPVITTAGSSMQEIAGEAALYADVTDPADIAASMILLYKNETLRNELIQKGQAIVKNYTWDKTASLLWQSILKAAL